MYKLVQRNGVLTCIQKLENNLIVLIPFDPANTDYQEYLKWVAEGNEPLPHDAPVLEQTSDNTFTVQL